MNQEAAQRKQKQCQYAFIWCTKRLDSAFRTEVEFDDIRVFCKATGRCAPAGKERRTIVQVSFSVFAVFRYPKDPFS
jgi:hypothetical protein